MAFSQASQEFFAIRKTASDALVKRFVSAVREITPPVEGRMVCVCLPGELHSKARNFSEALVEQAEKKNCN